MKIGLGLVIVKVETSKDMLIVVRIVQIIEIGLGAAIVRMTG